jgi:D-alanyl-lipoteichoic acid acyltransferase DltB (MBOAT superfamily)
MDRSDSSFWRKTYLCVSLFFNLGILFCFKYANFLGDTIHSILGQLNLAASIPHLTVMLPVGISFYTFQTVSYTIDVYRKVTVPEKHFGIFAVYVAFFPQLVAGPIERSHRLLPQFRERKKIEYDNIRQGMEWAMWGLFKKVVIADLLSEVVNTVYAAPHSFSGIVFILATVFFSIQIYCDFSGYSDIARGIAKMLGYDLMINFRQPYFSKSIVEFWQRWHISLSTWFRDYLYIPLGGNRVSKRRWHVNILIVFLLSGLWHGAKWNYVLWGLLHGLYLVIATATNAWRKRLSDALKLVQYPRLHAFCRMATVFVLVLAGWIVFRAQSITDAMYIFAHLWNIGGFRIDDLWSLGLPRFEMAMACVLIMVLFGVDYILSERPEVKQSIWRNSALRYTCYALCFYGIVFFGVFGHVEFIYFQF